jgi:hypothetical protein
MLKLAPPALLAQATAKLWRNNWPSPAACIDVLCVRRNNPPALRFFSSICGVFARAPRLPRRPMYIRAHCGRAADLSRYSIAISVAIAAFLAAPLCGQEMRVDEEVVQEETPEGSIARPRSWPDDAPLVPESPFANSNHPQTLNDFRIDPGFAHDSLCPPTEYPSILGWLGLRHQHTHGRHVGRGEPLVGSSWLNRPYYAGIELGPLWITRPVHDNIASETDLLGGFFLGWDRDPYWGAEIRFNWATPELINHEARDADRTDSLFAWNYSLLYYPWGDATWRPYWRAGVGDTNYDFPLDDGSRHDQWMLTFPLGVGVKYPIRPWLAARGELVDNIGVGHHHVNAQHNVTLTFALEWHFGAHPRSYWPWQPYRHIW